MAEKDKFVQGSSRQAGTGQRQTGPRRLGKDQDQAGPHRVGQCRAGLDKTWQNLALSAEPDRRR